MPSDRVVLDAPHQIRRKTRPVSRTNSGIAGLVPTVAQERAVLATHRRNLAKRQVRP